MKKGREKIPEEKGARQVARLVAVAWGPQKKLGGGTQPLIFFPALGPTSENCCFSENVPQTSLEKKRASGSPQDTPGVVFSLIHENDYDDEHNQHRHNICPW